MRYLRRATACVLIPVFMSGCASLSDTYGDDKFRWCIIGGAAAGAAAGALMDGEVGGALVGLAVGAVAGEILCEAYDGKMMAGDSDGDGVLDDADLCPGTPPEASNAVDGNGCPLYSDGDNVPDYLDKCPGTEAGVKVDKWGCPVDSDGDGFTDDVDKCPNEPAPDSEDGCPVMCEPLAIITNVNFDFDSARVRSDAGAKLAGVIDVLKASSAVKVRVVGHTDSTGSEAYNLGLSDRRATSVRKYMAGKGISMTRMSAIGKGEGEPLVSNKSRAGRAVNRRVEFEVVGDACK